jgi:hypothetical protein
MIGRGLKTHAVLKVGGRNLFLLLKMDRINSHLISDEDCEISYVKAGLDFDEVFAMLKWPLLHSKSTDWAVEIKPMIDWTNI